MFCFKTWIIYATTTEHRDIDKLSLQQIYMYGEILAVDGGMNNINT